MHAIQTIPAPILLVEDDDNDVFLMRRAFTVANVENPLFVAHSGEHAVELLKRPLNQPCLLITDINLPGLDGFDLLVWLQNQPRFRDMPKLVISASVFAEDLDKALVLGATACFTKPHGIGLLVELVRQWKEGYLERACCAPCITQIAPRRNEQSDLSA